MAAMARQGVSLRNGHALFPTSDHGFSTISKESRTSSTVKTKFADTLPGHLPLGFVALDLARALNLPLNADIGRTIAQLMHLDAGDKGKLIGRVLSEVLPSGALPDVSSRVITSEPAANGLMTVLDMQQVGETLYFDVAGFPGRTVGLSITATPGATTQ